MGCTGEAGSSLLKLPIYIEDFFPPNTWVPIIILIYIEDFFPQNTWVSIIILIFIEDFFFPNAWVPTIQMLIAIFSLNPINVNTFQVLRAILSDCGKSADCLSSF